MTSTDILAAATGPRWNIFVLLLVGSIWLVGEYVSLKSFETHVDVALQEVTTDVRKIKSELTGISAEVLKLHKRMDDHERPNAR